MAMFISSLFYLPESYTVPKLLPLFHLDLLPQYRTHRSLLHPIIWPIVANPLLLDSHEIPQES